MAATLRELRGRIRSAGSIKKITKAQELIATSRIAKAQSRLRSGPPLCRRDHPDAHHVGRRGRARPSVARRASGTEAGRRPGGFLRPWPVWRLQLQRLSPFRGVVFAAAVRRQDPVLYTVGRKALNYYMFRNWTITASWTGFSEQPTYQKASEIVRPWSTHS